MKPEIKKILSKAGASLMSAALIFGGTVTVSTQIVEKSNMEVHAAFIKATGWMDECTPYETILAKAYFKEGSDTFTVGGNIYNEGIMMGTSHTPLDSYVLYNLDNLYDSFSFDIGKLDGSSNDNVKLSIYYDDILNDVIEINCTDLKKHIDLDVRGVKHLAMYVSKYSYNSVSYAVFNGSWTRNNNSPSKIGSSEWLKKCPPYETVRADMILKENNEKIIMSGKEFTDALDFNRDHEPNNDYAKFNLDGMYHTFSFTAGHVDNTYNGNTVTSRSEGDFVFIMDGAEKKTIHVVPNSIYKKYSVPIAGVNQMIIEFRSDGWTATRYAIAEANFYKEPVDISKCSIVLASESFVYTGKAITPQITITDKLYTLSKDVDYTAEYTNNKEPGTATITIKGIGDYKGLTAKTFKIVQPVSSITLNKTKAEVNKGSTITLTATVSPSNATNKTVTWTSSDTSVATVSGGVVKGVAKGTATITAKTSNGKTASCSVTVTEQTVDVTGVTLSKTSASVNKGGSITLTASVTPTNATNKNITWSSSNTSVATVSGGVVKGVAKGTATITAATYNGKTAKCTVTVTENTTAPTLKNVVLSSYSIDLGEYITITCGAKNGTAPYQYAAYYSLNGGSSIRIADYSETAKIKFTPSKAGTYKIIVKVKDAAGKVASKNYEIVVSSKTYALTNTSKISASTIQLGDKLLLTAKAQGGTGFYKYAFYQRKSGDPDWKTIKTYSAEPTEYFKPSATGDYEILIKVKDSSEKIAKSTFALTVNASDKKIHLSTSFDKTTVYAGEAIYAKAFASGGTGYYKYGFYYKPKTDDKWITVKAFSASNEAAFALPETGDYEVCVKVKDSNNVVIKKYYNITSRIDTLAIKNNSTVSASSTTLGSSVKMTASGTGGTGVYEYSMLYRLEGETEWSILQSFGKNTTVDFKPEVRGKYELNIKVSDSDGSQTEKYFDLTVN